MKSLLEVPSGQQVKVFSLERLSAPVRSRLIDFGVQIGQVIRFVRVAPFSGPIEVSFSGTSVLIRQSEASLIDVEEESLSI